MVKMLCWVLREHIMLKKFTLVSLSFVVLFSCGQKMRASVSSLAALNVFSKEPTTQQKAPGRLFRVFKNGKVGFIDRTGKLIIPLKFPSFYFTRVGNEFSDGMARIQVDAGRSPLTAFTRYRYGYIDMTGTLTIPPQFEEAEDFSEGLAVVKVHTEREGYRTVQDRYGYIDKTGRMAIPAKFYAAGNFSEGLASFCEEGVGCGFMNHAGRMVFMLQAGLTAPSEFHDGLATVFITTTDNYGFIDHTGRLVYEGQFGSYPLFSKGMVLRLSNRKRGLIDQTGQMVMEITHPAAYYFQEGMAIIAENDKAGYVDLFGRVVITPRYTMANNFSEGLAAVAVTDRRGGLSWGYVDKAGHMVIPARFNLAGDFIEGIAPVTIGVRSGFRNGYIDKTGRYIWRPS
jgi:hypothetical protein